MHADPRLKSQPTPIVVRAGLSCASQAIVIACIASLVRPARLMWINADLHHGMRILALQRASEGLHATMVAYFINCLTVLAGFSLVLAIWSHLSPAARWPTRLTGVMWSRWHAVAGLIAAATAASINVSASYQPSRLAQAPNVVLVVVDTLRADHVGCYGYARATTPNIDRLARDAFVFRNTYSPSSWTRSAVASILTSKTPLEHGITSESLTDVLAPDFLTLQEYLRNQRYRTAAIITNPHYRFGIDKSFDEVSYSDNGPADGVYTQVVDYITANRDRPFFLLIHNNDPHSAYAYHEHFSTTPRDSPYRRVEPLLPATRSDLPLDSAANREHTVILGAAALEEMKANYDGEIAFLDYHVDRLVAILRALRLWDRTIVVITADHGEEFLDHGSYWHGGTLFEELIRVPLIVHVPGLGARQIDARVNTLDIFPTLIDLVGGRPLSAGQFAGRSLVPLMKGEAAAERDMVGVTAFRSRLKYSLIRGDYKLIAYATGETIGLFNLQNDPHELHDIERTEPDRTSQMAAALNALVGRSSADGRSRRNAAAIDATTKNQLRALGYVGD
jgi:arylsulfatase A-like enzyme